MGTLPPSHFLYGQVAMNQLWHNPYGLPVAQYSVTAACSLDQQAFTLMSSMMFQVAMQTLSEYEQVFKKLTEAIIKCNEAAFAAAHRLFKMQ